MRAQADYRMVCNMQKKRNSKGFTMAELLIVVAIITILSGVGFIAVQTYQKSLAQTECNAIAKEIFIAAQNHLTMAESQGYLADSIDYGTPEDAAANNGIYYFSVTASNSGSAFGPDSVLGLMLPFASIDDTVRKGGNYVIRYQANPAIVLDVCYMSPTGRYKGSLDYNTLKPPFFNRSDGNTPKGKMVNKVIVGYYGGAEAQSTGVTLNAPVITVDNAERLTVTVDATNVNQDATGTAIIADNKYALKLLISNVDGTAMAAITLHAENISASHDRVANAKDSPDSPTANPDKYVVTLDDITAAGMHFCDIASDATIDKMGTFLPGEDIIVSAVAYSNSQLSSIAYSNQETVNSLFADLEDNDGLPARKVAQIANFRHFENLDSSISGLVTDDEEIAPAEAMQIEDLVWASTTDSSAFTAKIAAAKGVNAADVRVYKKDDSTGTQAGCCLPVNTGSALIYDGKHTVVDPVTEAETVKSHSITGVKVGTTETAYSGAGGLFGAPEAALTVMNLALIDFEINASGNAGALAGTLPADSSVSNVIAYHTSDNTDARVTSTGGSAGGLIGSMDKATVEKSAAALVVSGKTNAGGLVGTATEGSITTSYSGGHTQDGGKYAGTDAGANYNVTANGGSAGGLIGKASDTQTEYCYSTCSATGKTVGGLVGNASGGSYTNCYATGLVLGSGTPGTVYEGAFIGEYSGTPTECFYYSIINERAVRDASGQITGYEYLKPIGSKSDDTITGVSALDETAASFNGFYASEPTAMTNYFDETQSTAYDPTLANAYPDGYALRTVAQLDVDLTPEAGEPDAFVATHYGDWPTPETYVLNEGTNVGSNTSDSTDDFTF